MYEKEREIVNLYTTRDKYDAIDFLRRNFRNLDSLPWVFNHMGCCLVFDCFTSTLKCPKIHESNFKIIGISIVNLIIKNMSTELVCVHINFVFL